MSQISVPTDVLRNALFSEDYADKPYTTIALLEAARWPELMHRLSWHDGEWLPLHTGEGHQHLYEALPHAVTITPETALLDDIAANYGKRNTLFVRLLKHDRSGNALRLIDFIKHFAPIPHVQLLPHKEWAWMRLYDAEILQDFWAIAMLEQKALVLGTCVHSFWAENPEKMSFEILDLEVEEQEQLKTTIPLKTPLIFSERQQEAFGELYEQRFIRRVTRKIATQLEQALAVSQFTQLQESVKKSLNQAERLGWKIALKLRDTSCWMHNIIGGCWKKQK